MALWKKIVCCILLVLIVCVGAAAVWLYDDVEAVLSGVRYSVDELEEQITQNEQVIKGAVAVVPDIMIRDLTEEDKQSLKDGTVTKEELVEALLTPVFPPKQDEESKADADVPVPERPKEQAPDPGQNEVPVVTDQKERDLEIAKIVAETYILRAEFLQRLDGLMAQAMGDYKALKPAERKGGKLATLVSDYLSKGLAMEKKCDSEIEGIIARLETALRESGRDLSLAETVFDTYLREKSLKKSWYMAQLKERGLI